MKYDYFSTSVFFSLLILIGCGDKEISEQAFSVTPTQKELEASSFMKFIDSLNSLPSEAREIAVQQFLQKNPNSPVTSGHNISFIYYYGSPERVFVKGDMAGAWTREDLMLKIKCGSKYFHYKAYKLPPDAQMDYLLSTGGRDFTDPGNPVITPSGYGFHSQLSMPGFKPDNLHFYNPDSPEGRLDSLLFRSYKTSVPERFVKIYVPAGYDTLNFLPAIYINDGYKALEYCSYKHILDNLISSGKIKPVVVVFIGYREEDGNYFMNNTSEYISALCDELVPLIDDNFKTSRSASERLISGFSAGAHVSIMTALQRGDIFMNAAGQSTTISKELMWRVKDTIENKNRIKYRFYTTTGRYDLLSGTLDDQSFLYANQILRDEMKKAGLQLTFHIYNGGHQWSCWREYIDEILIWFAGPK